MDGWKLRGGGAVGERRVRRGIVLGAGLAGMQEEPVSCSNRAPIAAAIRGRLSLWPNRSHTQSAMHSGQ